MRSVLWLCALVACKNENGFHAMVAEAAPTAPPAATLPPPSVSEVDDPPPPDAASVRACAGGDYAALLGEVGYASLASAVLAAEPGDEVVVCPGVHDAPVVVSQDLTLRAADPTAGTTVIAAGVQQPVPGDLTLFGLTFPDGASVAAIESEYFGSDDLLVETGSLTVDHCRFEHERFGILAYGTISIDVRHSWFVGGGTGVLTYSRSPNTISLTDTVMTDAHAGLQVDGPSDVTLTDVSLERTGECGAIVVTHQASPDPATLVATDTRFWSNRPGPSQFYAVAAAVSLQEGDSFDCTGCDWFDNLPHDLVEGATPHDQPGSDLSL